MGVPQSPAALEAQRQAALASAAATRAIVLRHRRAGLVELIRAAKQAGSPADRIEHYRAILKTTERQLAAARKGVNQMADSASPMRVIGWEEALLDAIAHHEAQPFEWGKSDCFIFPMDVVLALTGNDPWADERDYDSALSAARRLNKRGFENTGDAFAAKLESVPLALARRGDIGIADASQ